MLWHVFSWISNLAADTVDAALVTSLASNETAGHLQSGSADPQGAGHSHSGVSQWPDTDHVPIRTLRSSDAPLLAVPRTRTELARRAFSVAAPSIWNSLPADIRLCESVPLSATWKPICSDSLSPPVLLQAPLYLRTSRRYRSVLLLLIVHFSLNGGNQR